MNQPNEDVSMRSEGASGAGGVRRPYVAPFVCNLDVETTGGKSPAPSENVVFSSDGAPVGFFAPS